MVKRWEKKGRKPILQLEESSKNSTLPITSSSGASTSGLRGLIQYDDSDNENGVQDSESCVTSAGETKKIDLEVADFLKEIDALTEIQDTSEAEAKEEEGDQPESSAELVEKQNNGDLVCNSVTDQSQESASSGHLSAWQQCYDSGSGYTYYWNMETNQVTWECPEEVLKSRAAHSSTANHNNNTNDTEAGPSHEGNGCRHLPLKKQPHRTRNKPEVGKIIPISYFDQSTTSDSSDDENSCSEPHRKRKKSSPEVPLYGPVFPRVPNVNSPDTVIQSANGLLSSDEVLNSSSSPSEVVYGPQLPDTLVMNSVQVQRLNECDILAPSSSDQADRTLTNGISSPLDLSHPLDRDNCDQSNVCESSDSVRETVRLDIGLSADQLLESRSSPLIQVRNITESVEPGTDSVETCEVEPSTSSQDYVCVSVCDSEEPDSTCTSRKTESSSNQLQDREATSLPQSLKSILQYEESESEPETEPVSASPEAIPHPLPWVAYVEKNSSGIDTSNFIGPLLVGDANQSPSSDQSNLCNTSQSSSSTIEHLHKIESSKSSSSRSSPLEESIQTTGSSGTASFSLSQTSSSSALEEPRQSTSSGQSTQFYLPVSTSPPPSILAYDTEEIEEPRQVISAGPSCVLPILSKRHGIGFNNLELLDNDEHKQSTSSVCPGISFVRSSEVFELKKLNEEPSMSPRDLIIPRKAQASRDIINPNCNRTEIIRPSTAYQEQLEEELDIDDIEMELDKALERKKNSTSTSAAATSLEMPSTSRNADLISRDHVLQSCNALHGSDPNTSDTAVRDSLEALSSDLLVKLKLLNAERSHLPLLTLLLIMLETRHTDWQRGALSSEYFAARLQESSGVLRQYEQNSTPPGWTCAWDRQLKKYFFIHEASGNQQFEFPTATEEESTEAPGELASTSTMDLPASVLVGHSSSSAGQNPMVTSSTAEEFFRSAARNSSLGVTRSMGQALSRQIPKPMVLTLSSPEPPVVQPVAPPLPPSPPPPVSPPPAPPKSPPPPPDSTELKEDYDVLAGMDVEDSNSKESSSDANPSSSSGSSATTARSTVQETVVIEGAPLPSSACLEQEQVAFYESLGSSCTAQTSPTNAGVVISTAAIISKPPQTISCPSVTAVSTSDIPSQQPQDNSCIISAPTTFSRLPTEFSHVPELDTMHIDVIAGSPGPSSLAGVQSIPGPSGVLFPGSVIGGPPIGVPIVSVAGPSGLCNTEFASSLCVPDPSGFSVAGPSTISDPIAAIPGPSHSSGENSSLNSTTSKKDKKKTKLSSGLSLKRKNISSLVQKWQKIKKEQLLEEDLAQNERRSMDCEDKRNSDQDGKISTTM